LLVDDFVSKGRTLLAAAATLQEALPEAEVRAFALARTLGYVPGLEHLVVPCEGEILWLDGDAWRTP
jgi:adenine/guanine phosphoribosyltransferase-like PRPP-binding protein